MKFDIKEIATATMILFAVIDIIGSIPIILDIRKKTGSINSKKTIFYCFIILSLFLFIGEEILNVVGVTISSFAVAGSFIIFFLALEMILGIPIFKHDEENIDMASIFPLVFPIIVGAGTLTALLSLRAEYQFQNIIIAILINLLFVYVVLIFSRRIENFLGSHGIAILRRIFGIILLAISVKLFATNVKGLF